MADAKPISLTIPLNARKVGFTNKLSKLGWIIWRMVRLFGPAKFMGVTFCCQEKTILKAKVHSRNWLGHQLFFPN